MRPRLYDRLDRLGLRSYRAKIMAVAFLGTHVPLIVLAVYLSFQTTLGWADGLRTAGVTLAATLVGTALTLLALNALLRPVTQVSRALRAYRATRRVEPLPEDYRDEVGTLMADAGAMVADLERSLDVLRHFDAATGLPNRARAVELIADRIALGRPFAVVALRFEDFARIAGALGLNRAERAAAILARRLRGALDAAGGPADALARVSEAEFALILPVDGAVGAGAGAAAAARVRRLTRACGEEIDLGGARVQIALHAGVAFHPDDGEGARTLLDHALAAAAEADRATPVVPHSAQARARARARLRIEEELRRALRRDELELHHQPIVDVAAGRVVGTEALLRWRHPERGLLPPGVFVEIAEQSGLIDEIGLWTLRRACEEARAWAERGSGLWVAVNLSARQFADPALDRHVAEALEAAGLGPERLEVELTETAVMADHERSRRAFERLRALGVGIAIDDFGTGYASLSQLRALPFTKLKIDREFVRGVEGSAASQAICSALIELSWGLGIEVLAEGVESEAELRCLRGRGCRLFQGYHFSRPVPPAALDGAVERIGAGLSRGPQPAPTG